MTIANGNTAVAADVLAIQTTANSALTAAGTALANAASALTNSTSAQATAAEALTVAGNALVISALPLATSVSPSNLVPVSQGGTNVAVTLTTFNAGVNASIASVGSVAAAAMTEATNAASLAAEGLNIATLPVVTSVASTDLLPIDHSGTSVAVTAGNLLAGETTDLLTAAGAVGATDIFPTGQAGSSTLTKQTAAAINTYIQSNLPSYKQPMLPEVTGSTLTLDGSNSNGRVVVVSGAGCVVSPGVGVGASGVAFSCLIVTAGSGSVVWGGGIVASNGGTGMAANSVAEIIGVAWSGGTLVLANVGGGSSGGSVTAPGSVSGLTLGAVTSSSLTFSWIAPGTGGTASWCLVQYRTPVGSGSWTSFSPNPTANSVTITGLSANTTYDVQVAAANAGGASAYVVYGQSPAATTATSSSGYAPNTPVSLAVATVSQTSITWTWAAGATDSTHNAATGYYVETSTNGTTWSTQTDNGNSTSFTLSGLAASTTEYVRVAAYNGTGASAYTSGVSGETSAPYAVTPVWASSNNGTNVLPPTTPVSHTGSWPGGGLNFTMSSGVLTGTQTPWIVYSSSGATPPQPTTTGGPACWQAASDGQSAGYGQYCSPPASAGTWYVWAVVTATSSASSTIVGATASQAITVT